MTYLCPFLYRNSIFLAEFMILPTGKSRKILLSTVKLNNYDNFMELFSEKHEKLHLSISTYFQSTILNPFPNKPWFLCVCSVSLLKTLWEKEKLLIISNSSSFSHSVFYLFGDLSSIFIKFEIVLCKPL